MPFKGIYRALHMPFKGVFFGALRMPFKGIYRALHMPFKGIPSFPYEEPASNMR